jgi:hypothetical protein
VLLTLYDDGDDDKDAEDSESESEEESSEELVESLLFFVLFCAIMIQGWRREDINCERELSDDDTKNKYYNIMCV